MALIECHECNESISDEARACPKCGAKRKSKIVQFGKRFFGGLILLLIIAHAIGISHEQTRQAALTPEQRAAEEKAEADKKEAEAKEHDAWNATYACRQFIEKSLKDPDSIKYPDEYGEAAQKEKDGAFLSLTTIRAKNSFGAMVPSAYECRVRRIGDKWFLVRLKEHPLS